MPRRRNNRRSRRFRGARRAPALTTQVAFNGPQSNQITRVSGSVYYTVSSTTAPSSLQLQNPGVFSSRLSQISQVFELIRCKYLRIQFTQTSTTSDVLLSYTPYFDTTSPTTFTQCSEMPVTAYNFSGVSIPGVLTLGPKQLGQTPFKWYHTAQLSGELTIQGLLYHVSSSATTIKMRIDYIYEFTAPAYPGDELKDSSESFAEIKTPS